MSDDFGAFLRRVILDRLEVRIVDEAVLIHVRHVQDGFVRYQVDTL